jgi:hypothetical protein
MKSYWGNSGVAPFTVHSAVDGDNFSPSRFARFITGNVTQYSLSRGVARPQSLSGHFGEEKNLLPLSNVICGVLQVIAARRNGLHWLMTPVDTRQLQSVERLREQFYFRVVLSMHFLYVSVHRLLTESQRIISCVDYGLYTIYRHPPCTTLIHPVLHRSTLYYTATSKVHVPEPVSSVCGF